LPKERPQRPRRRRVLTVSGVPKGTRQQLGAYQFVAGDGGVTSFGNAAFAGSLGGQGVTDVVGMASAT